MKFKIKKKEIILLILLILIPIKVSAGYYEKIENIKLYFFIAKPILVIEKQQSEIVKNVYQKEKIKEFYFTIRNYEVNNNVKEISEVPFFIDMKIENSNQNFPIEYKIYDCENNEEITEDKKIFIDKNIEFLKKYKVITSWKSDAKNSYNETNIIFNIEQA